MRPNLLFFKSLSAKAIKYIRLLWEPGNSVDIGALTHDLSDKLHKRKNLNFIDSDN